MKKNILLALITLLFLVSCGDSMDIWEKAMAGQMGFSTIEKISAVVIEDNIAPGVYVIALGDTSSSDPQEAGYAYFMKPGGGGYSVGDNITETVGLNGLKEYPLGSEGPEIPDFWARMAP
jgi:hypothetical protein